MDQLERCVYQIFGYSKIDEHGCWIWQGNKNLKGYGKFCYKRKNRFTHRVVCLYFKSDKFFPNADTMHSCDNPPCVNPDHLEFGTRGQNLRDAIARGLKRRLRGVNAPTVKLTDSDVLKIRALFTSRPFRASEMKPCAKAYDVTVNAIKGILYRTNWKHI